MNGLGDVVDSIGADGADDADDTIERRSSISGGGILTDGS